MHGRCDSRCRPAAKLLIGGEPTDGSQVTASRAANRPGLVTRDNGRERLARILDIVGEWT